MEGPDGYTEVHHTRSGATTSTLHCNTRVEAGSKYGRISIDAKFAGFGAARKIAEVSGVPEGCYIDSTT